MSTTTRILIVDDEPDIRELLEITLSRMNLATQSAGDLATARRLLAAEPFNLCLTDMRLPDGDGLELVRDIQARYPHIPVAVITAHGSTETAIEALKSGAFDFVSKPVDLVKLRALVQSALKLSAAPVAVPNKASEATTRIVGSSRSMQALKAQIMKVARSQAPVFISGESGSGKELVARAIHMEGPRKDREFVAINCGAIPAELMESEFFGHRKGSFTGADQDKIGLFQAAHGGSLFLDEVADLPLHMQVKLLRAIQEKSIRPIGSQTEIAVDVRLISATHKSLAQELSRGTLRQDLYYRINVIEIHVPPLRERADDIPALADFILASIANAHAQPKASLSPAALDVLQQHPFPGNVRELENLLLRACALADNAVIQPGDLPDLVGAVPFQPQVQRPSPPGTEAADEPFSLEKHLEKIEREAIEKALTESRWNRTAAARKLGMSFRSFRYRLKKLGLD
ncbi:MAG TPA: sigma-54 dependent transcriptional regulator [Pseudomonadales bacterium]